MAESRKTLIPQDCYLGIQGERLRGLYSDLKTIPLPDCRVAVAATFRVFLELSFDEYLETRELFGSSISADDPLAVKMKAAAADLYRRGQLDLASSRAVADAAESDRLAVVSARTFEQFVHSGEGFPDSVELRDTWDRLEPFFREVWPR